MKILYLDCTLGVTSDMLLSALLELRPDRDFLEEMKRIVPQAQLSVTPVTKCGVRGTSVVSTALSEKENEEYTAASNQQWNLKVFRDFIGRLPVSEGVRKNAAEVCTRIAKGESMIHGIPLSRLDISKGRALRLLTEIIAVCILMERLGPNETVVSPVDIRSEGAVRESHPAALSAAATILYGIPGNKNMAAGNLQNTAGAALLRQFASRFGNMPLVDVEAEGYGIGKKRYIQSNCVRAVFGQSMTV